MAQVNIDILLVMLSAQHIQRDE